MAATIVSSLPGQLAANPPGALIAMLVGTIPFGLGGLVLLGVGTIAWPVRLLTGRALIASAVLLVLTNAPLTQPLGGAFGVAHDTLFYAAACWIGVIIARAAGVARETREQPGVIAASI